MLFEARLAGTNGGVTLATQTHCTELSFANLVSLAEVYPRLLEPGRRVRELISMLQLVRSTRHPGGVELMLDLDTLLRGLKSRAGSASRPGTMEPLPEMEQGGRRY